MCVPCCWNVSLNKTKTFRQLPQVCELLERQRNPPDLQPTFPGLQRSYSGLWSRSKLCWRYIIRSNFTVLLLQFFLQVCVCPSCFPWPGKYCYSWHHISRTHHYKIVLYIWEAPIVPLDVFLWSISWQVCFIKCWYQFHPGPMWLALQCRMYTRRGWGGDRGE